MGRPTLEEGRLNWILFSICYLAVIVTALSLCSAAGTPTPEDPNDENRGDE